MHKKFDSTAIEKKWQEKWKQDKLYDVTERDKDKKKEYVLVEWPYPSGNLHIGHWYAFAVPDIYVRFGRMNGKQVIYPMGFDAFGLPAENAAIKRNIDPGEWTESNMAYMRQQLGSMGNAFTWNMTTNSTDEDYYRWTQWMFTQFFEKGIAYRGVGTVNWCPSCNTVIANEQVLADDTCERCGSVVEKKEMPQWMMKITDYADRLVDDLDNLDWPEHIKEAQRNWIGRSEGSEIDFKLSSGDTATVFTTRPDTLFGATYMVLAPEHPLVAKNEAAVSNWAEAKAYIDEAAAKDEKDRLNDTKEKTGVKLEGVTAINPASGEEIPVYIADYVLAHYGTGAIMAVPAHDERDNAFAKKFGIAIKPVIAEVIAEPEEGFETIDRGDLVDLIIEHPTDGTFLLQREKDENGPDHLHFVGGGTEGEGHEKAIARELEEETGFSEFEVVGDAVHVINTHLFRHTKQKNQSGRCHYYHIKLTSLNQSTSEIEDGKHTIEWVSAEEVAEKITWHNHRSGWDVFRGTKMHTGGGTLVNSGEFDGMDSEAAKAKITEAVDGRKTNTYRLHDWSVGRQRYWGVPIPIVYDPEGNPHPVKAEHLPWTLPEDVDFKPTGEAPLAKSAELRERTEKLYGEGWTPEVETLDTFVDSSWYFLRYIDNQNDTEVLGKSAQADWMPIDIYFGGAEHTTVHLLYSRWWQKVLFDMGITVDDEPYTRRINRGLILGPDGNKMSKSKGNVIDPDEQVALVGADAVKMYLGFMGPYEGSNYPWDMGGLAGIRRFLERVYGLSEHITEVDDEASLKVLHQSIAKVAEDVPQHKFNTAISAMMVAVNQFEKTGLSQKSYETFLKVIAPFAPHLSEELWAAQGHDASIHNERFPTADATLLKNEAVTIGVQINGKLRGEITISPDAAEADAMQAVQADEQLVAKLPDETKKVIYVPGKILNLIG